MPVENNSNKPYLLSQAIKALFLSIVLSVFTIVIGVLGYLWILAPHITFFDALYMTIITLSTVGFNEIVDLSNYPLARGFTLGLIIFGVGNLLFLFTSITAIFSDNELQKYFKRKRLMKNIKQLNQHIIVCGLGNVGLRVASEILKFSQKSIVRSSSENQLQLVAVENNSSVIEKVRQQFPHLLLVEGDVTEEMVLQEAGIMKASQVITALSDDRDNILLTVTTKKIRPSCRVIAKIKNIGSRDKLLSVGADAVISPQYIGALRIVSEIINPHSQNVIDRILVKREVTQSNANYHWQELHFHSGSSWERWIGKNIDELEITKKFNIPIIAIKNGENINYRPLPQTTISQGDILILIANTEELKTIKHHLK